MKAKPRRWNVKAFRAEGLGFDRTAVRLNEETSRPAGARGMAWW
jgi:hypothetical protein